ncbi:hypothetical protein B7P43_G06144 [Cryptotermes secundus]|uniref:Uncharacterized protein n=1 Tax=Cryptotermes secundus TaxID=105785 RepID=A0A2J7QQ69_9NEOP|nr:hypothetical protein B7P43_G06144 [Cryptotermes secundus]
MFNNRIRIKVMSATFCGFIITQNDKFGHFDKHGMLVTNMAAITVYNKHRVLCMQDI